MKTKFHLLIGVILLIVLLLSACTGNTTTTPATSNPTTTVPTTGPATTAPTTGPATTGPTTTATTKPTTPISGKDPNKYGGIFKSALTVGLSTPLGYPTESANDAYSLSRPALESLVDVKSGGKVIPLLATSWDIDVAAKTMTFHLRKGVKFHDGTDFNAKAVKWNFDLIMAAKKAPNFNSVEVIDDYTLRISVKVYKNTDLTGMFSGAFAIISPTNVEKNGVDYARNHPVGTGPFKFVEYQRDSKLTFARNDNYWDTGKPYLDGLEYYVAPEETVRKILFLRGDVHRLQAGGIIAQELKTSGYDSKSSAGGTFVLVPDSNNSTSQFADIKVRQALSYAINRESLAQGLGFGSLSPSYQLYSGNPQVVIPGLQKTEYNPTKAKELLNEAGYLKGFKTTVHTFTRLVQRDWVTALAKMFGDVGIQTTPDFPESGKYEEYRSKGWSNSLMAHGLINADNLNSIFNQYFPETNLAFPSVKKPAGFYEAINASITSPEVDPVKLQAVFKLMADDFMVIPFAEETVNIFYAKGVHDPGADEYPLTTFISREAWLEPSAR